MQSVLLEPNNNLDIFMSCEEYGCVCVAMGIFVLSIKFLNYQIQSNVENLKTEVFENEKSKAVSG